MWHIICTNVVVKVTFVILSVNNGKLDFVQWHANKKLPNTVEPTYLELEGTNTFI
jgi:hypothetical protein